MATNAKQAAIATSGLAIVNGILLALVAYGAEGLIIAIEQKQHRFREDLSVVSVFQSLLIAARNIFLNAQNQASEKIASAKNRIKRTPKGSGADEKDPLIKTSSGIDLPEDREADTAAIPNAVMVIVAAIFLINSILFCLVESLKVLSHPEITKENLPGESEETKRKRKYIKYSALAAFCMQTIGQGLLQGIMAISLRTFFVGTRKSVKKSGRDLGIQALRLHVGSAAAVYFATGIMMGYAAHQMQEANVGN